MTQEEKELLLIDLSARLLSGVFVQQSARYSKDNILAETWEKEPHNFKIIGIKKPNTLITDKVITTHTYVKGYTSTPVTICIEDGITHQISLPYLRPMSSMTEEEIKELSEIDMKRGIFSSRHLTWHLDGEIIDYLNKKMLDWRRLIPRGLAFEAPEGMYK